MESLATNAAALSGKALKGKKPQGRRCSMAFSVKLGVEMAGNQSLYTAAGCLGISEGEPKPMRGSR